MQDPYIWDVQNDTLATSSMSSEVTEAGDDEAAVLIPFSRAETAFAAVCAIVFTIVGIAGRTDETFLPSVWFIRDRVKSRLNLILGRISYFLMYSAARLYGPRFLQGRPI